MLQCNSSKEEQLKAKCPFLFSVNICLEFWQEQTKNHKWFFQTKNPEKKTEKTKNVSPAVRQLDFGLNCLINRIMILKTAANLQSKK